MKSQSFLKVQLLPISVNFLKNKNSNSFIHTYAQRDDPAPIHNFMPEPSKLAEVKTIFGSLS